MSHFYARIDGKVEPKHFVPNASKGGLRPSRITDAKKAAKSGEIWYSSVTTVLNILDKPALVNWKVDKHLDTVYEMFLNDAIQSDDIEGFRRVVKAKTQEQMDLAPQAGTDIHQVLEDYAHKGLVPTDTIEALICENVRKAVLRATGYNILVGEGYFTTEKYFIDEGLGYAGCADLVCGEWVIDYKSKQTADKFKVGKMAYPEHSRQLASYGHAMCNEGFRAANIFVCLETGEVDFHEHDKESIDNGFLDFLDCLSIYKRNTYNPLV